MILKIFNPKLLLLCGLLTTAQGGFAQTNKMEDEKKYALQMKKLQDQMRDLQKEMNKLQTREFAKKSAELQKLSKDLLGKELAHVNEYNIPGAMKGLGLTNDGRQVYAYTIPKLENLGAIGSNFNYNFSYPNDKRLQEQIQSGDVKVKAKAYSKSYPVDGNDKLSINNVYGKVTVNTWTKNEIKVDVEIKAYANEDSDAQKLLDNISIVDSKENSLISFKTNIERNNETSNGTSVWSNIFSGGKSTIRKSEINYTVYMPSKSQLQITNRYGAISLPDMQGKVTIENAYSSLIAKNLSNPANEIKVRYGSANIENLGSSHVSVAYGSLNLGEADKLNAEVSYGPAKIGKLTTSATINMRYGGGLQIADVDKNLKTLQINSAYSGIKLGLADNENADFNVTVRNGSFSYGNRTVNLVNQPTDDVKVYRTTRNYKGTLGKGSSDKTITINSNYGSVKFD